jgi:tetratricopeptide (TPR) repeat protein
MTNSIKKNFVTYFVLPIAILAGQNIASSPLEQITNNLKSAKSGIENTISDSKEYSSQSNLNLFGGTAYAGGTDHDADQQSFDYEDKLNPKAKKFHDKGLKYSLSKNYEGAIEEYNKAIEINPKNPLLYHQLGLVHKKKGNLKEAIRLYDLSLKIDPNFGFAIMGKGMAYHKINDKENAKKYLNEFVEDFYNSSDTKKIKRILKKL